MRKRIAVFANGWGSEYLREVVTGAYEVAREKDVDIFVFISFSRATDSFTRNLGEVNIYKLPDLKDFDGALMMANSFNQREEIAYVHDKVRKSGIPAVSVEYALEGIVSLESDNYCGMHELAEHLVTEHAVKRIVFIGGPQDHPESQMRLKAVQDVAEEHGLTLREDDVLYGDWAKLSAKQALERWQQTHEGYPDAIICANDVMAMGAVDYSREHGYDVPSGVLVTGYDCTNLAQEYRPTISSVSHEWFSMGKTAMHALTELMAGGQVDSIEMTKTRFVRGGSCGCKAGGQVEAWDEMGRNPQGVKRESLEYDSHFRHIYQTFRKAEDKYTMHDCFGSFVAQFNWIESKNFTLCLEPEFFNIVEDDENLLIDGYSEKMEVVCSLKDGEVRPYECLTNREVMLRMPKEQSEPQIYLYLPMCRENRIYGYAILVRDLDIILDTHLYSWVMHMEQGLEVVRSNIIIKELTNRLTKLSVTDVLTGIYNRAGCEQVAYPLLMEGLEEGICGVTMLADVDRMKDINDHYGHANGDLALKTAASVLTNSVPEDWIVCRFGGDEFFIGGLLQENDRIEEIVQRIADELSRQKKERKLRFDLSISVGYSILNPKETIDLEKSLQEADKRMYRIKDIHHKEMDRKEDA